MLKKTLVHITLMTIPHWLRYARAPTNCLGPPRTLADKARQDVLSSDAVRYRPIRPDLVGIQHTLADK